MPRVTVIATGLGGPWRCADVAAADAAAARAGGAAGVLVRASDAARALGSRPRIRSHGPHARAAVPRPGGAALECPARLCILARGRRRSIAVGATADFL